jgi:hypothetical protein
MDGARPNFTSSAVGADVAHVVADKASNLSFIAHCSPELSIIFKNSSSAKDAAPEENTARDPEAKPAKGVRISSLT